MFIGYARVSKEGDQDTTAQARTLKEAGCKKIYEEKASGGRWDRPQLQRMLEHLREGDVVVVWKLDRLSRSLRDLLTFIEKLSDLSVGFISLTEHIDTTTPAGIMLTQMLGSFAEFERAMIRERTKAGLALAREQGRVGGRKPKLETSQIQAIQTMVASGQTSAAEAARLFNVHRSTICRILRGIATNFD
ncbi:recombinase family protein [Candidatus Paracaedibacter symbiosus]|uniref:recombinase family protein n=1 Tax=Candidatus Paracaedibacter symbiosus TaxID=244582 RepID=UPI0005097D91|nr:recombinase family protein [Candidatus Paracaedibacter symbiosus]